MTKNKVPVAPLIELKIAASISNSSKELTQKEICSIQSYLNKGYKFYLYVYSNIYTDILGEYTTFYAGKIVKLWRYRGIRQFKKILKRKHPKYIWADLSKDCDDNILTEKIMKDIIDSRKIWIHF